MANPPGADREGQLTPAVSIIVPARNAGPLLGRCLRAIRNAAAVTGLPVELIVADNGSVDDTSAVARLHGARVLAVPGVPVAAVRNRGVREAAAPVVGFVDADHEVGLGWVEAAVLALAEPGVVAAGADYRTPSPATWVQRTYDALRRRQAQRCEVTWLPSGNLVVRRAVFLAAGGFDETLQTCEDVDLCRRLLAAGHRILSDPALSSVHYGDPATLGAVFRGEVWRGRDNLRVTLRSPRNVRSILSAVQPLTTVGVVVAAIAASLVQPRWAVTALGLLVVFVLLASAPRALQMWTRRRPRTMSALPACAAVALAFDLGRAVALVARVDHGYRRRAIAGAAAQ